MREDEMTSVPADKKGEGDKLQSDKQKRVLGQQKPEEENNK